MRGIKSPSTAVVFSFLEVCVHQKLGGGLVGQDKNVVALPPPHIVPPVSLVRSVYIDHRVEVIVVYVCVRPDRWQCPGPLNKLIKTSLALLLQYWLASSSRVHNKELLTPQKNFQKTFCASWFSATLFTYDN